MEKSGGEKGSRGREARGEKARGKKTTSLETDELNLYANAFIFYLEYEQSMDACRGPVADAAVDSVAQ